MAETVRSTRTRNRLRWILQTDRIDSAWMGFNSNSIIVGFPVNRSQNTFLFSFYFLSFASLGRSFVRIVFFANKCQAGGMGTQFTNLCSRCDDDNGQIKESFREYIYVKLNHWHSMVIWLITFTRHWIEDEQIHGARRTANRSDGNRIRAEWRMRRLECVLCDELELLH